MAFYNIEREVGYDKTELDADTDFTTDRKEAQRWADEGARVVEYARVGFLKQKE